MKKKLLVVLLALVLTVTMMPLQVFDDMTNSTKDTGKVTETTTETEVSSDVAKVNEEVYSENEGNNLEERDVEKIAEKKYEATKERLAPESKEAENEERMKVPNRELATCTFEASDAPITIWFKLENNCGLFSDDRDHWSCQFGDYKPYEEDPRTYIKSSDGPNGVVSSDNIVPSHDILYQSITLQPGESVLFTNYSKYSPDDDDPGYAEDDYVQLHTETNGGHLKVWGDLRTFSTHSGQPHDWEFYKFFYGVDCLTDVSGLYIPEAAGAHCYDSLFANCKSLKKAPNLNWNKLGDGAAKNMFRNCECLTDVTGDIACSDVGEYSCESMFEGCKQLRKGPNVIMTGIANGSCKNMFKGCHNLESVDGGLYGEVKEEGCLDMFSECWAITLYPDWYFSDIGKRGCYEMFRECRQMVTPDGSINGSKVGEEGCSNMFYFCTSLKTSPGLNPTTVGRSAYESMFFCCASLEEVPRLLPASKLDEKSYALMFAGCLALKKAPELPAKDVPKEAYKSMFGQATALEEMPDLPANTVGESAYESMFYNCTAITEQKELPATTLDDKCYMGMFEKCTSLKNIQKLKANTKPHCYEGMYEGCLSLEDVSNAMLGGTVSDYCYAIMFKDCTALKSVQRDLPEANAEGCYEGMFENCRSLKAAPILLTPNAEHCYNMMFKGCSSLEKVYADFSNWGENYTDAVSEWLSNVAPKGTFVCQESLDRTQRGASRIPEGWTIQNLGLEIQRVSKDTGRVEHEYNGMPINNNGDYKVLYAGEDVTADSSIDIQYQDEDSGDYISAPTDAGYYYAHIHAKYNYGSHNEGKMTLMTSIVPKKVTIKNVKTKSRKYEKGNTNFEVEDVEFDGILSRDKGKKIYTVDSAYMENDLAGEAKQGIVMMAPQPHEKAGRYARYNYIWDGYSSGPVEATVNITKTDKIELPTETINVSCGDFSDQIYSLGYKLPEDMIDGLRYDKGNLVDPKGIISHWSVDYANGVVKFTISKEAKAGSEITLPVVVKSTNYEDSIAPLKVHICNEEKAEILGDIVKSKPYDGKQVELAGDLRVVFDGEDVTDKIDQSKDVTYEYCHNGEKLVEPPVNAGKYQLVVTVTNEKYSGERTIDFEITKRVLKITGGKAQERAMERGNDRIKILSVTLGNVAQGESITSSDYVISEGKLRNYWEINNEATFTVTLTNDNIIKNYCFEDGSPIGTGKIPVHLH